MLNLDSEIHTKLVSRSYEATIVLTKFQMEKLYRNVLKNEILGNQSGYR